jgi:hypothetical protein
MSNGFRDFNLVYTQPIRQEPNLYFSAFEAEFKGFKFKKETEHNLYFIVCPEGHILPFDLQGRFSKIQFLEEAITKFLSVNPTGELAKIPEPSPYRSHHKPIAEGGVG